MRRRAISAHEVLSAHSWAGNLWMSSRSFGGARMRYAESVLQGLREGGFSPDLTYHAFHVLQSYVLGVTLQEQNLQFEPGELKALAERYLRDFPADEYPELAEHVRQHMEPSEAHGGTFEFGLEPRPRRPRAVARRGLILPVTRPFDRRAAPLPLVPAGA